MSRTAAAALALWLAALPAAPARADGAPPAPTAVQAQAPAGDEDFRRGYGLFEKKDYPGASILLHRYAGSRGKGDDNYEWAQFFLGISLYEQGFSHAAADLLSHLVSLKPNARVVSYSLDILQEIAQTRPFDRDGVLLGVVCDQEYGFVEQRHQDFIHYYQGLYDWEHGYRDWGDAHFAKISKESPYHFRYLYQKALSHIDRNDLDGAAALLKEILAAGVPDRGLRNDCRITLARISYEQGRYDLADAAYQDVDLPNVDQARYLLERAWAHYRAGNPQKAMGLLYAFEAPSFWRHFTPEYFLLKSFVYRDVCQYPKALNVVEEFHRRYGDTLRLIYDRAEPGDNDPLLVMLLERRDVRRLYDFLGLLERETALVGGVADPDLAAFLRNLYALQVDETGRDLRSLLAREYEALAEDLLSYEEQAHLTEYEVGLDLARRVSDARYRKAAQAPLEETGLVAFAFQGEFWNDELDDYRVVLENKCDSPEEWDVFFK